MTFSKIETRQKQQRPFRALASGVGRLLHEHWRRPHFAGIRDIGKLATRVIGGMPLQMPDVLRGTTLIRLVAAVVLLTPTACSQLTSTKKPAPQANAPRAQLSIGYSLLYQEADGIPKLKWLLTFKDKPAEVGRVTDDLTRYYLQLAESLRKLSRQFPAMRIDVTTMSDIEADERKAIGADLAKDFAPLVGKKGIEFEREALLMFYDTLNEQRHLVGVMIGREPEPPLRKFLETTKTQLDAHYNTVGELLERRYFNH